MLEEEDDEPLLSLVGCFLLVALSGMLAAVVVILLFTRTIYSG